MLGLGLLDMGLQAWNEHGPSHQFVCLVSLYSWSERLDVGSGETDSQSMPKFGPGIEGPGIWGHPYLHSSLIFQNRDVRALDEPSC